MGYNTKFRGMLRFTSEPTVEMLRLLNDLLADNETAPHEHNGKPLGYPCDLAVSKGLDGLVWPGQEKTYHLENTVNWVIDRMREEFPGFGLEGEMRAQGEDVEDRWVLRMVDGRAMKVPVELPGEPVVCPECGHRFFPGDRFADAFGG